MSSISVDKAIARAMKIMNPHYDMTFSMMHELSKRKGCDVICDSFLFGYNQGMKAAKAEQKKKEAATCRE